MSKLSSLDWHAIESALRQALSLVSEALSDADLQEQVEDMSVLIDVGEYGVALEQLCSHLEERKIVVPAQAYSLIASAGTQMQMLADTWECLKPQVAS